MTIRRSLLVGLTLLVALGTLQGAAALLGNRHLQRSMTDQADRLATVNRASAAQLGFERADRAAQDSRHAPDPAEARALADRFRSESASMRLSLDKAAALEPALAPLRDALNDLLRQTELRLPASTAGGQTRLLREDLLTDRREARQHEIATAVDVVLRRSATAQADAAHEANHVQSAIIGLVALSMLGGLSLALLLHQRVLKPLAALSEATRHLTAGELDHSVEGTARKDEIGGVATALEALRLGTLRARTMENEVALERSATEARIREANERLEERVAAALVARAEIEEALRQSQKMEAVGQLTGGLAHDFNNMLASIGGALEIMQARIGRGRVDNLERYIDAAQGAARRASALTHRLLAFSRRQTLDPRPTDVNQLVAGMQELICRTAGPEISVEVVADPDLSSALIDPNQLENALLNLCINARDAMPGGGLLTIRTANCRLEDAAARDADVPAGHYNQLVVSDTGTGMPPDVVSRAFDPFFTTKPIGQGTGLGLSMVYGFVRQSGGMVAIDSAPGAGTSVRLHLPRYIGAADAVEPIAGSLAPVPAERGDTILVVDDEPSLRMLVVEVLQERGYHTLEAQDGATGLRLLRSQVRIDLLLTDVGLPGGMNGRQLADAAQSLRPGLKVMFITGYAEHAALNVGNLAPGMEVLTKPFSMEVLTQRIQAMLEPCVSEPAVTCQAGCPAAVPPTRMLAWSRSSGNGWNS